MSILFLSLSPDDYRDMGGKTATFSLQVKAVAEPNLPEIDEGFATSFGINEGSIDGLRQAIKENLERELNSTIKASVKRQVMQGILEANNIPLPQAMINDEVERMVKQANQQSKGDEQNINTELFEKEARRRVNLGLVIARLVADNNIELEEARLNTHLESIASTYEDPEQVIQWYRQSPQLLEAMSSMAL